MEVECDEDILHFFPLFVKLSKKYEDLDHLLKPNWHQRIFNQNGDYAFTIRDTLRICFNNRLPIKEFAYHGGKYVEVATERRPSIVFTFVLSHHHHHHHHKPENMQHVHNE